MSGVSAAKSDYEIQTLTDGRWLTESVQSTQKKAIERAEQLHEGHKFEGVRVIENRQSADESDVIFEQMADGPINKVLKVGNVEEAPVCDALADYYTLPARLTAGRLLRQYLDDQGLTVLELAYNAGQLNMLERTEPFFNQVVQRAASLQARKSGEKPAKHVDALYSAFGQVRDRARESDEFKEYTETLKKSGLQAAIDEVKSTVSPENRRIYILGALAPQISALGDWDAKLQYLVDLFNATKSEEAETYLDEVIAEILDGTEAVNELLGGQQEPAVAFPMLVQLTTGNCPIPGYSKGCLEQLNSLMERRPLPLAKQVLLERVERGLSGIRPLTREGRDKDRQAFVTLIRQLTSHIGLLGGPGMCHAVTLRGKMLLSSGEGDLSIPQSIDQVQMLIPNRLARLGYLSDLSQSDLGEENGKDVLHALMHEGKQVAAMQRPADGSMSDAVLQETVAALKEKLSPTPLPDVAKTAMIKGLDAMLEKAPADGGGEETPDQEGGEQTMSSQPIDRKTVHTGSSIFVEGEEGAEAYLIADGEIEIFRKTGNRETIIATLGRGEIFGEMSLIDNQPRMASARATADSDLIVISQESLGNRLKKLEATDRVMRRLIDMLVNRLRGLARIPE